MSNIAKGWGAPIIWDEVFSSIILEVAKELGIDVTAEVNKRGNCLFIRITIGSYYSIIILGIDISGIFSKKSHNNTFTKVPFEGFFCKDSFDNININGLDVTEKDFYDDCNDYGNNRELVLKTCIGVRNNWFNEKLFPKLYDKNLNKLTNYGALVEKFCANFSGVFFERMVRYPVNHYRFDGNYASLEKYLSDVFKVGIWDGYELEYLQVGTPSLDLKLILNRDHDEIEKLKEQLKFHIKLMLIIDWIYRK